ncbi:MAG: cytochrome c oxidase assembly protein [Alcanivorax sp.]|nr:cytochrome c oxidase assembly protein [Alcanivorax sp.]
MSERRYRSWALGLALLSLNRPAAAHSPLDVLGGADGIPALLSAIMLGLMWVAYLLGSLVGSRRVVPRRREALAFHSGVLVAALALFGPFDDWAKTSSAMHMTQHMLLMVVIPPLWVLGRPLPQWRAATGDLGRPLWQPLLRATRYPLAAALVHGAMIWIWHAPGPYMVAVENVWWHLLEHLCFLLSGWLFWWAVLRGSSLNTGKALVALLLTLMHTGLLGALLTFAGTPIYDEARSLADQQLAGLIMWVPGGIAYLVAISWIGYRWLVRHT